MSPRRNSNVNNRGRRPGRPRKERRISVRSDRREQPDLHRLGRALAALALAQAEADAKAERDAITAHDAGDVAPEGVSDARP